MVKTLLLCFIHGFKGNEDTFYDFPEHLKTLITDSAPQINVEHAVYPKYETQGDLPNCVTAFREWLQTQVLEREKALGNTRPMADPSVGVILLAHSMGGLVAADSLLSLLDEREAPTNADPFPLFPLIHGVLTFDTPFCGLSRSMFAYGAFAQYRTVSSAYGLVTSVSALPSQMIASAGTNSGAAAGQVASPANTSDKPAWRLWQSVAMRTGAAGAIAAAGAAAYMNRENIGRSLSYMNKENVGKGLSHINRDEVGKGLSALNLESIRQALSSVNRENIEQGLAYMSRENIGHGFAWVSSHLQFVSALVKGNELQSRIERVSALEGVGFADLYTSLGPNDVWSGGYFIAERTFCAVPNPEMKANKFFIKEINTKAKDEPDAHLSMFMPARNTGYDEMAGHAKGLIMNWAMNNGKGVVDRYRLNKAREGFSRVTRYTYGEKSGLTEVEKAKQSAKEAKGWGIWPRRKADDKAGQPESKPTRYVVDGKSGLIEISTDGKRIPVEQDPVQKAVDEVAPEPEATPDDGEAQSNAEGEETGGASELDLENVPGVTEDLDLEGTSDGSGFPKEASQEETVAPAG